MEKIVNRLISEAVVGADRYTNNGSTWLIFTETRQWVIELTKEKTLWYNYNFFKNLFSYMDFDVVENQDYITKWVEDTIINGVKGTNFSPTFTEYGDWLDGDERLDEIIQNGVKHTPNISLQLVKGYGVANQVENTINNGIKEVQPLPAQDGNRDWGKYYHGKEDRTKPFNEYLNDVIENGIKEY